MSAHTNTATFVVSAALLCALTMAHRAPLAPLSPALPLAAAASPRSVAGLDERWRVEQISLEVDESVVAIGEGAFEAVSTSAWAWQLVGAKNPAISCTRAHTSVARDGVSSVVVGEITLPGHERDVAVTISYADEHTGSIVEADIILNSAHRFAVLDPSGAQPASASIGAPGCADVYDLQSVVTHELGHLYGLDEDRDNPSTTMGPRTTPCSTSKRYLSNDDRVAMRHLYDEDPAAPSCSSAPGGRSSAAAPIAFFAAALAALAGLRRLSGARGRA